MGGVEAYLHLFLTSALDGGELSASRRVCFDPEENPRTHRVREVGWAGLDLEKGIEPRFLNRRTRSLITILTKLPQCRTVTIVGFIN